MSTEPDIEALLPMLRLRARQRIADRDSADDLVASVLRLAVLNPRPGLCQTAAEAWLLAIMQEIEAPRRELA